MKYKLYDVHCHLDFPQYDDIREKILNSLEEKGIRRIIVNGTNPITNQNAIDLAKKYDFVKSAMGIHPMEVKELTDKQIDDEIEKIRKYKDKILAIGEVGLDNKREKPDLHDERRQLKTFQKLIDLAIELNKPLIIHSRKAELKVIEMLEANKVKKAVMHAFMGKKKYVERAADNGYYFSILPIIYKLEQIKYLVKYTAFEQLLLETDSPYMSPDENINDPSKVKISLQQISKIKQTSDEKTSDQLWNNYLTLFEPKNI